MKVHVDQRALYSVIDFAHQGNIAAQVVSRHRKERKWHTVLYSDKDGTFFLLGNSPLQNLGEFLMQKCFSCKNRTSALRLRTSLQTMLLLPDCSELCWMIKYQIAPFYELRMCIFGHQSNDGAIRDWCKIQNYLYTVGSVYCIFGHGHNFGLFQVFTKA